MGGQDSIRNFCILAHIDHGKSTLADRLLELTGTIPKEKLTPQFLDQNPIERERGITIKLAPVRMKYKYQNPKSEIRNKLQIQNSNDQNSFEFRASNFEFSNSEHILNLIDTPGHVDFSYEVSRTLAAVEGAILLVDATQGTQAQTLAYGLSALEQNLTLVPVINKIDLPNADIDKTRKELVSTFGFSEQEILLASGKTGEGVEKILKAVIERIPAPKVDTERPLRALIFGSFFDYYKGVIAEVRVIDGQVAAKGLSLFFLETGVRGEVREIGYFAPNLTPADHLASGEIGYIATGIKEPNLVQVGDTISTDPNAQPLPGYKKVKPMVFVGLYSVDARKYPDLKEALEKFKLNDPAFFYEPEQLGVLGPGFRCGFLGLLHAEVVQERLSEEFNIDLIAAAPSVEYLVDGEPQDNPAGFNPTTKDVKEPWVALQIFAPQQFIGAVMKLVQEKRGKFINMKHFGVQVELIYQMPLSEMVVNFYDKLKQVSSGFASFDWKFLEYRDVEAVRVDILVAGEKVDALSRIVYKPNSVQVGRSIVKNLKELLPRHLFEVALQAAINGKIIARETLPALRKDVTAKLYGGDVTRKMKLLEKQKKGKKRMKMVGRVEIPQEVFLSILKS